MAHGLYSYSPASSEFLPCSTWHPQVEGAQNFPDFPATSSPHSADPEEFPFAFSPPGHSQDMASFEDLQGKWMSPASRPVVGCEPMRKALSRSSTGNVGKNRISKPAPPKGRRMMSPTLSPTALAHLEFANGLQSGAAAAAAAASFGAHYQTASPVMDQTLFLDADMMSGSFCQMLPSDGLALSCEMNAMHVDPAQITQMRLDTSVDSPCTSWESLSSSSRMHSPACDWTIGALASPTDSQGSPLLLADRSPRTNVKGESMLDDDMHGGFLAMMSSQESMAVHVSSPPQAIVANDTECARDHPYYKRATPASDGLYHCPFEGDPSCNHKPEKLKCNYDKFVDSHLKPYRCKMDTCADARFSSTACLLRHEREAHAMHGHGDKPFLCTHEGCDRAVPGNGFPRQWNLRDHMKRVHHTVAAPVAAAQPVASQSLPPKGRKRKGSDGAAEPAVPSRKPSVKAVSASAAQEAAQRAARALSLEWRECHSAVAQLIPRLARPDGDHVMDHIQEMRGQLEHLERLYGVRHVSA